MSDLLRRRDAVKATLDRFKGHQFSWKARVTCIHLARFHARQMGYRPPRMPPFASALGAKRALAKLEAESLSELLDRLFPRVEVSRMLIGDLVALPGEPPFEGLAVACGNFAGLMFHEDASSALTVARITSPLAVWRL